MPRFLDHDLAMHELLVDAAGNELLARVYRSLLAMGTAARRQASESREVREQALLRHGEIVAAVRARDGQAAAAALSAHLQEFGASVARTPRGDGPERPITEDA